MKKFNRISVITAVACAIGLLGPVAAFAATSPSLGTASIFGILSDTFTRNVGVTAITGSVGYTTLSGGGSNTVTGTTFTPSPPQAGLDEDSALANLNAQVLSSCNSLGAGAVNLDNVTGHTTGVYTPGCYSSGGAMNITTGATTTLNGAGTYIFKSSAALTTAANSWVVLTNGASACDVFWIPTGATTIGAVTAASTTPNFVGNIFRGDGNGLSITLGHFSFLLGRALAFGSTVTADTNNITVPSCAGTGVATLHVIKNVVNTAGGSATSSDFSLSVKLAGTNIAGSPALGTTSPGTLYLVSPGTYAVSEGNLANYTQSFSASCPNGAVTLADTDNVTCTVTNTYTVPVVAAVQSSGSMGGGSTHYGCKDPNASNYEYFASSDPSLCRYGGTAASYVAGTTTVASPGVPNTGINDQASITHAEAVATFKRSLSMGMSGTDVAALQTALVEKGFLVMPPGIAKGYFGALTRTAVLNYQAEAGLPQAGVFGPMTRARLISGLGN